MKKYRTAFLFLFLGILLFIVSAVVGSSITTNGILEEPAFFCIPLGYLSLALAGGSAVYSFFRKKNKEENN
ncbi:MAG: DUF3955 domain-containing protein [Enterococcaceae bacterium]|jgi:uncharacterized membrane protein|nr:DUF3955 domain-containing protein [Enterococcaceae bacterium]